MTLPPPGGRFLPGVEALPARAVALTLRGRDRVLDRAQAFDLDPHRVTRAQELGRVEAHADPARGAGEDEIARPQGARLADEAHELPAAEDEVGGPGVLAQLPVDPGPQPQVGLLADLVHGGHPRPEGAERVSTLGPGPLGLAALEVAG